MKIAQLDNKRFEVCEYFKNNGYPDCIYVKAGSVIKVERFQNGVDLHVVLQKGKSLGFNIYLNKANIGRCILSRCYERLIESGCNCVAHENLTRGENGIQFTWRTNLDWCGLTAIDLPVVLAQYNQFRHAIEPCVEDVPYVGEGYRPKFDDVNVEVVKRALDLFGRYCRAASLIKVASCCFGGKLRGKSFGAEKYLQALSSFEADAVKTNGFKAEIGSWIGFNSFAVLKTGEHEIRHSNVLAWLLDAMGTHGIGATFLKMFFEQLCDAIRKGADEGVVVPDFVRQRVCGELNLSDFRIFREDDDEDIKLESESNRMIIVIENKWNADAGENQLSKYADRIKKELERRNVGVQKVADKWGAVFAYLTLNGDRAVEAKDDKRWVTLSYLGIKRDIANLLSLDGLNWMPSAKEFCGQYYKILQQKPELMSIQDELVVNCARIYTQHALALELIWQAESVFFNCQIQHVLEELRHECGILNFRIAPGVAWMRVSSINELINHDESGTQAFRTSPYCLQVEYLEGAGKVCCNLIVYDSQGKMRAVKWRDKSRKGNSDTNDKNWKSFVAGKDTGWNSLKTAVKDAVSEVVAWVQQHGRDILNND